MTSSDIASQVNTPNFLLLWLNFEVGTWVIGTKSCAFFLSPACIFNSLDFHVRQMMVLCQFDLVHKLEVRAFIGNKVVKTWLWVRQPRKHV